MDAHLLRLFKTELKSQCEIATAAAHDIQTATGDTYRLWFALQGLLGCAGNISKLLWGSGRNPTEQAQRERERRPLRDALEVTDDSPLRPRKVRNAFEHWDERIEDWFTPGDVDVYASRNVGPPDAIMIGGKPPRHFGSYDPSTGLLTFWEESVSVPDLIEEMGRIYTQLRGY